MYAVGDNYEAAIRAGVRADLLRIGLFVAMSLSACLAGIIVTSQLSSAAPQIGDPYLLSVVTAVILGGASLAGGRGTLLGTLIAVAILGRAPERVRAACSTRSTRSTSSREVS